jgi:hypothetical protein
MAPFEPTDGLRRHAEEFDEGAPHALGVGETYGLCDQLDRLRALKQSYTCRFDTKPLNGFRRRFARFTPECPAELADTEVRRVSEAFDRQRLVQVIARERQRDPYPIRVRLHLRDWRKLGLRAGATVIHNQLARDLACQLLPMICLDECQSQVYSSRDTGRAPDAPIGNEYLISFHLNRGIILLQPVRHPPMRRRASPIEDSSFCE